MALSSQNYIHSQDNETVGPSAMVPGIPPEFRKRERVPAVCIDVSGYNRILLDVHSEEVWVGSYQLYSW